jgi:septum site-determining protein MinC
VEGLASALTINRPIRSGQQIYAKNRDLIIMGPVNPGAEVIADGNVTVFGPIRGKVIAGYQGNMNAQIFAKQLDPELVCIAGLYQLSDDLPDSARQGWVSVSQVNQKIEFKSL